MNNTIFRQKNIDRINSPESLNDYVKVTNPSIWIMLIAIIVFLIGALTFGALTEVGTNINAVAEALNGKVTVYVDESEANKIQPGMEAKIDGSTFVVEEVASRPIKSSEVDDYVLHKGNMDNSTWVYPVNVNGTLEDGVYSSSITVEKVSPLSFVFN